MAKGLQAGETEFILNDKYFSVISVISFQEQIYPGFLSGLNNISNLKLAIKHTPVTFNVLKRQVVDEINELKAKYQTERNINLQEEYRREYEDKAETINLLEQNHSRILDLQIHLIVSADTLEELNDKKKNINSRLSSMGLKGISLLFEQQQALMSAIPIFPKQDIEDRLGIPFPAITVAGMYPFTFDCLKDSGNGIILGADFSNGIILFNQFLCLEEQEENRDNANALIVGINGCGKSMLAKLLLKGHIRNNVRCFCIDPDGEYSHIITEAKGNVYDLDRGSSYFIINPLEIVPDIDEDEINQGLGYTALTRTINQLKAFIKFLNPVIDNECMNLFGQIVSETYARFNINNTTNVVNLSSDSYPTFDDVYATIKGKLVGMTDATKERENLDKIEKIIRPLVTDLKPLFTGHTNMEFEDMYASYNAKFVTNEYVKKALLFNALRYSWGKCLDKNNRSVIVIDKAELLFDKNNPYALEFISQIQRRGKKYGNGTITTFDNLSPLNSENLALNAKTLFDNTSYIFAMANKKNTIETLSKYIYINDSEKESINYLNNGEALFFCGNRRMNIKIILTPEEVESFEIIN